MTYWEIGNEIYGNWEDGFTTSRKYAEDLIAFATTMKTIDPSIKLGAPAMSDPHGRGDDDSVDEWNTTVVRTAGDSIDFLDPAFLLPRCRSVASLVHGHKLVHGDYGRRSAGGRRPEGETTIRVSKTKRRRR